MKEVERAVDSPQSSSNYRHSSSPISVVWCLRCCVFLLYIAIFPAHVYSRALTSVTLHTSITFRDYITSTAKANDNSSSISVLPPKGWPVLKAIESIRFYGGDIAGSRMLVTIFVSNDELQEHTTLYKELTRLLRNFNAEFYPQLSVPSTSILEASLRTLMLLNATTSHLLHFHHTNFFVSSPLDVLNHLKEYPYLPSIVCLSGYPLFSHEKCSPRLLLIENDDMSLQKLWKTIASAAINHPSKLVSGIVTDRHPEFIDYDSYLLNSVLPTLDLTTSTLENERIETYSSVVYLDHEKIFDIFFYVNESTSTCETAFHSVKFDIPESIALQLMEAVSTIENSCMILAEHAEVLPWIDVIEDGKTYLAERQEPWHHGYSICAAPACDATDKKFLDLNSIYQEEWSYLKDNNEAFSNSEITTDGKEHVILQKIGHGVQIMISGGGSCIGDCFARFMMTNVMKIVHRVTLVSIGFDNDNVSISPREKSMNVLMRAEASLSAYDASEAHISSPCIFHLESANHHSLSGNFSGSTLILDYGDDTNDEYNNLLNRVHEKFSQLGYITLTSDNDDFLHSYHILRRGCDAKYFERIQQFLPVQVYEATDPSSRVFVESAGETMKCGNHGNEFQTIDNSLHPYVLEALKYRINEMSNHIYGMHSYFIPFGNSIENTHRRTLIEEIIVTQLAPLVLGDVDEAIKDGYLGAEWWIQSRPSNDPKEYHLDTAITWCRENGWPADLIQACHFYPSVGSIFYLSSQGGPTVVFNQSMTEKGMTPILPKELSLIFPKENRLLMFKGNKYHGVLKGEDDDDASNRLTLLVNYWRDKTAGEKHTPTISRDPILLEEFRDEINGPRRQMYQSHQPVSKKHTIHYVDREFKEDIWTWKDQKIPKNYRTSTNASKLDRNHDEDTFQLFKLRESIADLDPNGTYQNWPFWKTDEKSRNIEVIQLPNHDEWRRSMPGGYPFENGVC